MGSLEDARREFFDECDFVLKVPTLIPLDVFTGLSNSFSSIPLYDYFGVKKDQENFCTEERYIKNQTNIGINDFSFEDMYPPESLFSDVDEDRLNIREYLREITTDSNKADITKFETLKLKVWSEVPRVDPFFNTITRGLAIIIFCLENNISPGKFNSLMNGYKTILTSNEIKTDIFSLPRNIQSTLIKGQRESVGFVTDFLMFIFDFDYLHRRDGSIFSLLGTIFSNKNYEIDTKYFPEIMRLNLSLEEGEEYDNTEQDYSFDKLYVNNKIKVNLDKLSEYDELLVIHYGGNVKDIFGPLFYHIFSIVEDYDISTQAMFSEGLYETFFYDTDLLDDILIITYKIPSIKIIVDYSYNTIQVFASKHDLHRISKEILHSKKAWIPYSSIHRGWETEGARFLDESEFKKKETSNGETDVKGKIEYEIWVSSEDRITLGTYDDVHSKKSDDSIHLLLDEKEQLYINKKIRTNFFKKKHLALHLIKLLLKNKGSIRIENYIDEMKQLKKEMNLLKGRKISKESIKLNIRYLNNIFTKNFGINEKVIFVSVNRIYISSNIVICFIRKQNI